MRAILVPVSAGELFDRISILALKAERVPDAARRALVASELRALEAIRDEAFPGGPDAGLGPLVEALAAVNGRLWDIEDAIRRCELRGDFGPSFVDLARSVYRENDRRASLKRAIDAATGSPMVEVKHHAGTGGRLTRHHIPVHSGGETNPPTFRRGRHFRNRAGRTGRASKSRRRGLTRSVPGASLDEEVSRPAIPDPRQIAAAKVLRLSSR